MLAESPQSCQRFRSMATWTETTYAFCALLDESGTRDQFLHRRRKRRTHVLLLREAAKRASHRFQDGCQTKRLVDWSNKAESRDARENPSESRAEA